MQTLLPFIQWVFEGCDWTSFSAERPDARRSLRSEDFPVHARDAGIVTREGCIIATAVDSEMASEIAEQLNENDWKREEAKWAL